MQTAYSANFNVVGKFSSTLFCCCIVHNLLNLEIHQIFPWLAKSEISNSFPRLVCRMGVFA